MRVDRCVVSALVATVLGVGTGKVAYVFATQRHNVSYVLGKMILPMV